jgi:hypothetical protein
MGLNSQSTQKARQDHNIIYVNFTDDPNPPAPKFPGAAGLRVPFDHDGIERPSDRAALELAA